LTECCFSDRPRIQLERPKPLSSNPIGASGMIRCLEAASQVRGTAGDYQVEGARVALGHAYGGGANYFAMWLVSSEPAPAF
jgi:acetyl-CoA C-acetyltransferase